MTWLKDARKSIINGAPLMSALIAPFATLYDIPALTQPWYTLNGIKIQDPQASLILSAISLACSVAANSLLALRFTVRSPDRWRHASTASTGIWLLKTTLGVANLITFGATRRNGAGFAYDEGFFCCIMSTVLSGILTSLLLTHMIDMLVRQRQHAPGQLHLDGRVFLLAELALVALIALEALIFSRIEHWSYLDGLYFSVVTLLTIGFGDFSPSTTAGKILVFPFAIAGIALLANQISLIVSVSTRNMAKYRRQLHAIEEATVADLVKRDNEPYLQAEARRLHHITTQQRGAQDLVDLGASFAVLVVFWLVSAAIYHAAEGWPFGDALYFSYIFFLSIGYGDYSPSSPAGKTVFVFWALVAVPIMTNFVVTAIQSLVTHFSRFLTSKTSEKREEWEEVMADYFVPHPALISQAKERLDVLLQEDLDVCERCSSREDLIVVSRSDLRAALDESLILESRGRSILVDQMKAGSTAWLLLQADRNIQERYLSDVGRKDEVKEARQEAADEDILDRIAAYRQSWARWLVLGGRLMKLDEKGLSAWERRELRERDA